MRAEWANKCPSSLTGSDDCDYDDDDDDDDDDDNEIAQLLTVWNIRFLQ
jgi:hypothetical protein